MVLTAPAIRAASLKASMSASAACLCGTVRLRPQPPCAKKSRTACRQILGRHVDGRVEQVLPRLLRELRVYPGRSAMRDRMPDDRVAISVPLHALRTQSSSMRAAQPPRPAGSSRRCNSCCQSAARAWIW